MQNYDLLRTPCVFCSYNGKGYWQAGTHAPDCPWSIVGGDAERGRLVAEIVHVRHERWLKAIGICERGLTNKGGYSQACKDILHELDPTWELRVGAECAGTTTGKG